LLEWISGIKLLSQSGFPASDPGQKKFNSRLVVPTVFLEKPFGEHVEGLCRCGHKD